MNRFIPILLGLILTLPSFGQEAKTNYQNAFDELHQMIKGEIPISFKRAVFITENAYLDNKLNYEYFSGQINELVTLAKTASTLEDFDYQYKDRQQVLLSASIFRLMKGPMIFESPYKSMSFQKKPYTYDMEDFIGEKDWTKMFVNKLITTQSGNCHSLPSLYKILADELGVKAWLAVAPSHTYIKQWSDKTGWYNTELTTGQFPSDADIKYNSYIKTEAIASGVYMDTLSAKETVAYVITDLAQGYIKKFGYEDIAVPLNWLESTFKYYPDNVNALILRAELQKKKYELVMKERGVSEFSKLWNDPSMKSRFSELEQSYFHIHQVGYRRMPKEMYLNWLFRVNKDTTRRPYHFATPQPFKKFNYNVQVITAGDGQNYEFFDQDEVVRVGTIELNRLTGKIVNFVNPKSDDMPDAVISRMYDPAMGRFMQIDPMAEKFYNMSPYVAMANNPIRYIDPDGMEFTDAAMEWVNKLVRQITSQQQSNSSRIASLQGQIDGGGLSDKKIDRLNNRIDRLQSQNTELEVTRGEINTMGASSQVYNVVESSSLNEPGVNVAATSFNYGTGAVDITLSPNSGVSIFGHELKHGYQFETGEISLGSLNGKGAAFLLDKNDEVSAYQRQALFGGRESGANGVSSLPERYNSLPTGPVDVTSHPEVQRALDNPDRRAVPLILQRLAKTYNQAYRVNGTTYK